MQAGAIIAAAGAGLRMQNNTRKQYLYLAGMPVLVRSVKLFLDCNQVGPVVVVIPPGEEKTVRLLLQPYLVLSDVDFVPGGETRQQSVANGLKALAGSVDLVCIHDAARPLASPDLLERLLETAAVQGSAVPVIPVSDTVKEIDETGLVMATLAREYLRLVQTPQVFRRELLVKAHQVFNAVLAGATDDAALVETLGRPVQTIEGEFTNLKITTALDLKLAEEILKGAADR